MTRPSKPGIDWLDIHRRYANGDSPHTISKALKAEGKPAVSRHAIEKRAKRNGWQPGVQPETLEAALATETAQLPIIAKQDPDSLSKGEKRTLTLGNRTPQLMAEILALAQGGLSQRKIAELAGVSEGTLRLWLKEDEAFASQFDAVRRAKVSEALLSIQKAQGTDWKAASWWLERSPATRDDFAPVAARGGSGPAVQVVVNVPRGDNAPMEMAEVVTIEPQSSESNPSD